MLSGLLTLGKMKLEKILQNIGLSEKEASIYLALLELEEALPSVIAKKAEVKRPTAYVILEQLKKRGLVSHVKKSGYIYFRAQNPHSLLEDQYDKYTKLEDALPELLELNKRYALTPQMTLYEGEKGMIQIMEDTLTSSEDLLCWADVKLAWDYLIDYYPTYIKKKNVRPIWVRGIFCDDSRARKFKELGNEEFREVYLIPKSKYPFKNEINIYDDKVAIISQKDKVGVIIQNQAISDTQKAIFHLGWDYARMLDKERVISEKDRYRA